MVGAKMISKDEIKSLILLKQQEMPFEVKNREDSLPTEGKVIVTIPGVRRCGKSTRMELVINELIQHGVPKANILWIGFDDERFASMRAEDLNLILDAYRELFPDCQLKDVWMFFDELPLVEGWELFVLRVFKSYCKNIFICGSNAHTLSKDMKTELRGWPIEYETFPLSFREYCSFIGIDAGSFLESEMARRRVAFDEFLRLGGMPEVALTNGLNLKYKRLQGYFDTMLLKDFIEHFKVRSPLVLRFFLKRVMAGISTPVSVNAIYGEIKAQGLKIAKDELYGWLQNACDIYLFSRVPRFSRSLARQETSLAKYYVIDTGLRNAVIPIQTDDAGKQLENAVYLELLRRLRANETISYYQDRGECDFVIGNGNEIRSLYQVTWQMKDGDASGSATRKREVGGLVKAAEALGCQDFWLVTHDEEGEIREGEFIIKVVPAWKWFCGDFVAGR